MSAEMGPVISAVDEYGDQRYTEGRTAGAASRQAEVDALVAQRNDLSGRLQALRTEYDAHMATHQPPTPTRTTVIGMSAPASLWDQRLREVGRDGITARRIFADFTSTGRSQSTLIEAAVAAGMLPIVSYKGSPSTANVKAVRDYLASLGVPVKATWHHEPHGDMTPAAFRDGSQSFLAVKSPNVEVGPILNGWLLDRRRADFVSYTSPAMLDAWDFLGFDTYQSDAQSTIYPGHRVAPLLEVLQVAGHPDMPVVVGEYNGWTADAIAESGRIFLDTPNITVACVWNSTAGLGIPLEGARLAAFKATKADARVKR